MFSQGLNSTPDVTSTSTGRMMNWSSLGALVLILMKAVWLSTSLDEKLALITPFVSNGGISWSEGTREEGQHGRQRLDSDSLILRLDTNTAAKTLRHETNP